LASVTLAGNVNIVLLHRKQIYEVLPESHELCSHIVLVVHTYISRGVSSTDRLVNINDVCKIRPAVWILNRLVSSRLPQKWS
jgi:hypothetical protein